MSKSGDGSAASIAAAAGAGLRDAVSLHNALLFLLTSASVRTQFMRCAALNLLIFAGSIILTNALVLPIVRSILDPTQVGNASSHPHERQRPFTKKLERDHRLHCLNERFRLESASNIVDHQAADFMAILFDRLYQLFWIYPVYCLSFLFNSIWYQNVADSAFIIRGGQPIKRTFSWKNWVSSMSEEVYRLLLIGSFFLEITLFSLVPIIGRIVWGIHLCWLYSFYSFEYKWALEGWSLEQRISYFEKRWPYFFGFGIPSALLTVVYPTFISYGVFAFLFPTFIILATVSRPVLHNSAADYKGLNIFGYAKSINLILLRFFRPAALEKNLGKAE